MERALIAHVEGFLLELGQGFAFVARQRLLSVGGEDFYLELLFFHIPTRRYVAIELKRTGFTPEAVGKLNFYVNVVDEALRTAAENPTVGLLLCSRRNDVVVRYALCPVCQHTFVPVGRQKFCTDACRAAGYRRRRDAARPPITVPRAQPRPSRSSWGSGRRCRSCA